MTRKLQRNRSNQTVPTLTLESGLSISTPCYLQLTNQQKKELLNAWRTLNTKQRLELGYDDTTDLGSIRVTTAQTPPQTELERATGCDEETLRMMLFSRQGIAERLIIKVMLLVGIELFTRQDIEETHKLWLDHLYEDERPSQTTKRAATRTKATKQKAAA